MARLGYRICVIVTVASFLGTGVLMEVEHHDVPLGPAGSCTVLTTHDCGSHEIHIPVDQIHPCLACALNGQGVSTPPTILLPTITCEAMLPVMDCCAGHPITYSYLFSGKRGPPCS